MIRAKCPFCGEENDVGLMEPVRPGEPTPMMKICEHFAFFGATPYLGAEYVQQEFAVSFHTIPGSYGFEAELVGVLNGYFKFVGPVAFAASEEAKDGARRAVEDFLRARKFLRQRMSREEG